MSEKKNESACVITDQNRSKIELAYINSLIRDMPVQDLLAFVAELILQSFALLSNAQLETEIKKRYAHLLLEATNERQENQSGD